MLEQRKYSFIAKGNKAEIITMPSIRSDKSNEMNRLMKKELLNVFRKFGYLESAKDYEIKIRTTSGNIAWININSIETIK